MGLLSEYKRILNSDCKEKSKFFGLISFAVLLVFSLACNAPPTQSSKFQKKDANNMSFIYEPSSVSLHPECSVWHSGDSLSTLYVGIPSSEFLFNQANSRGELLTKIRLRFELYRIDTVNNSRQLADSGSFVYNLAKEHLHGYFLATMVFRSVPGQRYNLRLITYDLMRKKSNQTFLAVDRSSKFSQQHFAAFLPSG